MNYRVATLQDVEAISKLLTDFFTYNAGQQPENYVAVKESGDYPSAVIRSNTGDFFVAESDARIVGLIHVEQEETPLYPSVRHRKYAVIVDFIVHEQYRKKNIGHLLLEQVKEWTRLRGLAYIELMVLENNYIGRCFYERETFMTVSRTMRLCL